MGSPDLKALERRLQYLESGARFDATKEAVHQVEQEFLEKLRDIRISLAVPENGSSSTKKDDFEAAYSRVSPTSTAISPPVATTSTDSSLTPSEAALSARHEFVSLRLENEELKTQNSLLARQLKELREHVSSLEEQASKSCMFHMFRSCMSSPSSTRNKQGAVVWNDDVQKQ